MTERSSSLPLRWIASACALAVIGLILLIAIVPHLALQSPLAALESGVERFPIGQIGVMAEGELA